MKPFGVDGVYISLGSNMGDRGGFLAAALEDLDALGTARVLQVSSYHDTAPVGGPPNQARFLNAVAELDTTLGPRALLAELQVIEDRYGRERRVRFGPRTLDLDLLLFRNEIIDEPGLIVPHPRMWQREFVMQPLAEICDVDRLITMRARLTMMRVRVTPAVRPKESPVVR